QTDHVDSYKLHNPPAEMTGDPATYEVLEALKAEHKIDHYGVSVHEPSEAALCLGAGSPEVLQIPFSLFRQEWIDETFDAARKADRKSTRLNSSHGSISYAVFCLKKKQNQPLHE